MDPLLPNNVLSLLFLVSLTVAMTIINGTTFIAFPTVTKLTNIILKATVTTIKLVTSVSIITTFNKGEPTNQKLNPQVPKTKTSNNYKIPKIICAEKEFYTYLFPNNFKIPISHRFELSGELLPSKVSKPSKLSKLSKPR